MTNFLKTIDSILTGSPLKIGRRALACGVIRTVAGNYIIVTGGFNGGYMDSTEILEPNTNVWERGPYLPLGITDAVMVEDPRTASVLLVTISPNFFSPSEKTLAHSI